MGATYSSAIGAAQGQRALGGPGFASATLTSAKTLKQQAAWVTDAKEVPYLSQVTFAAAQPMTINYGSFVYHDTKIPWSAPTHSTPPRTLIGSEVDAEGKLLHDGIAPGMTEDNAASSVMMRQEKVKMFAGGSLLNGDINIESTAVASDHALVDATFADYDAVAAENAATVAQISTDAALAGLSRDAEPLDPAVPMAATNEEVQKKVPIRVKIDFVPTVLEVRGVVKMSSGDTITVESPLQAAKDYIRNNALKIIMDQVEENATKWLRNKLPDLRDLEDSFDDIMDQAKEATSHGLQTATSKNLVTDVEVFATVHVALTIQLCVGMKDGKPQYGEWQDASIDLDDVEIGENQHGLSIPLHLTTGISELNDTMILRTRCAYDILRDPKQNALKARVRDALSIELKKEYAYVDYYHSKK